MGGFPVIYSRALSTTLGELPRGTSAWNRAKEGGVGLPAQEGAQMGEEAPQVAFPALVKKRWVGAQSLVAPVLSFTATVHSYAREGRRRDRGTYECWREEDTQELSNTVVLVVGELAVVIHTREDAWVEIVVGRAQYSSRGLTL